MGSARRETSGPMFDHVRQGRRYVPELVATGALAVGDWVRDDLPDLIWPALVMADAATASVREFVRWQRAVQASIRDGVEAEAMASCLDGRLTGLDRLAELHPQAAEIVRREADEHGLLSNSVVRALRSYPNRPAPWLTPGNMRLPGQDEVNLLARAIEAMVRDGHQEALLKCLSIWSAVQAGTFRSSPDMIELLKTYPNDPTTVSRADTVVRALWSATRGARLAEEAHVYDEAIRWAKVFWGANSMTTRCIRRRDLEATGEAYANVQWDNADADAADVLLPNPTPPTGSGHLRRLAMDLVASYVEALERAPARLYDPERQEVHAGLVCRAGREVIVALGSPDLWSSEHGSHVDRTLVEVRVLLEWMCTKADEDIFRRYQEYGMGKAKLYSRILDELPDDARTPGYDEALEHLDHLSHNDSVIDHRVVDTSDSFAGRSLRAMAEDCGLLDLYRHTYPLASGVAHSEWWSVETHAMERCQNILHRGHLIPSLSISDSPNGELAQAWVDMLYAIITRSLGWLGTDRTAVDTAFRWLHEPDS